MSHTDISVDLETLGTKPGSVITQIGLCAFDAEPGNTSMSSIELLVSPASAMELGMAVDWPTIAWWLQQDEAPRLKMAKQIGYSLEVAVMKTVDFIQQHAPGGDPTRVNMWGYGANFDITLLECAFEKAQIAVPWSFHRVRCLRTLANTIAGSAVDRPVPSTAHSAMHDAMAQAEWVQDISWRLNRKEMKRAPEQPQTAAHDAASADR